MAAGCPPLRLCGASALLTLALLAHASTAASANEFVRLLPDEGSVRVEFDPAGAARYIDAGVTIGAYGSGGDVRVDGDHARIAGAQCVLPNAGRIEFRGPFDYGADLPPDGSLGQSFTVPEGRGWVSGVWALLTCSGVDGSAATLTLRRDGPEGETVAQERVQPLPNDYPVWLRPAQPLPAGRYYLEVGEKHGGCYWWSRHADVMPDGEAYENDRPVDGDRCLGCELAEIGTVDIELTLDGPSLRVGLGPPEAVAAIWFPWQRDGYETADAAVTPFRYLWTDSGYWFPVHAFKRLDADWALEPASQWALLRGTHGFNLRVRHGREKLLPRMDADRLSILLGDGAVIGVEPDEDSIPQWMPRFFTSDPTVDPILNEFLWTYLTSHTSCPSSYEWDTLKLAWVEGPIRESLKRVVLHYTHRIDDDGFVWSRGESRGWDGGDCSEFDSRHYDGNAPFILACSRLYCWTGDRAFLDQAMPTVRKATDYLLDVLDGREGLLTIRSPQHTGIAEPKGASWPSDYFDCIPAGYQVAYINAFFLPATRAASGLEQEVGDATRAAELASVSERITSAFNQTFWDDAAGRYIGWVDSAGGRHDPGMTHVNTIAATYGLASEPQVRRMFDWMTNQPTESGQADTFSRWVFAPRSNTRHCEEQANRYRYEDWCEDGGAILWTAYYEIMARARFLGADDAWRRFREILGRFAEPDHLVGGNPLYRGERNNHSGPPGSVGVWGEFPESGIAPCAFLYAFVGVDADVSGLTIHPNLPTGLDYVGVDGLCWRGQRLKITAYRDRVTVETASSRRELLLDEHGSARSVYRSPSSMLR